MAKPLLHGRFKYLGPYMGYPIETLCGKVVTDQEPDNVYVELRYLETHTEAKAPHRLRWDVCQACLDSPKLPLLVLAETALE